MGREEVTHLEPTVKAQFQITDFFRLFLVRFCTVRLGYVFLSIV